MPAPRRPHTHPTAAVPIARARVSILTRPARSRPARSYAARVVPALLLAGSALVGGGGWWALHRRRQPPDVRAGRRAEREYRRGLAEQDAGRRIGTSIHPDFIRDWMR
jgi:hypothetical protein